MSIRSEDEQSEGMAFATEAITTSFVPCVVRSDSLQGLGMAAKPAARGPTS